MKQLPSGWSSSSGSDLGSADKGKEEFEFDFGFGFRSSFVVVQFRLWFRPANGERDFDAGSGSGAVF